MPVVGWPSPFFVFSGEGFSRNNNQSIVRKHITNNEKGNTMKCDPTMEHHCQKVLAGEYEIKGLPEIIDPVVVDIGANAGAYAFWAAERYSPSRIYCYEPNPETFSVLAENGKDPILRDRITMSMHAVVSHTHDGYHFMPLYLGKNNTGECSLNKGDEQREDSVDAQIIGYDELPENADILKIDIEHGEDVLLEKLLDHMPGLKGIALEWHSVASGNICLGHLGHEHKCVLRNRGILTAAKALNGGWSVHLTENGSTVCIDETGNVSHVPNESFSVHMENPVKVHVKQSDYSDLYVGIPVHYQPTCKFSMSCMGLKEKCGNAKWEFLQGDAHPDRARNRIVANFLKSDCQYLLFLDADLQFDPEQILSLYHRGKDMICGFYAAKRPGKARWIANAKTGDEDEEGLVELWEGGTGIMLIHRRVIEAIIKAYPDCEYTTDPGGKETQHAVFSSGPVFDPRCRRRRWLSEDWMFCLRAIKCGFTIYGDPRVVAMHEGTCMFPTEFNEGELRHE